MKTLPRVLMDSILKDLKPNKVVLLLGARRTGKTSLLKEIVQRAKFKKHLLLNGEDIEVQRQLSQREIVHYRNLTQGYDLLIIDEAQKIPNIGMVLKLMVDEIKGIKILVTGSSMFDLKDKLGEPLTGRKKRFLFVSTCPT